MAKFFAHGGPPRTQREYVKAATDCIGGGALEHAALLIRRITDESVRGCLIALLEEKKTKPPR
ncbi:MAG TPA: hypothetical protein VJB10_01395 [Candidatus Peribacteraceae bacterium]|nr:hypothetical protein [Candidatus Peribacteraceae bacterium]